MDQKVFQRMFRELTEYVSCHGGGKVPDPPTTSAASSVSSSKEAAPFDEPAAERAAALLGEKAPPAEKAAPVPTKKVSSDRPNTSSQTPHGPRKVTTTTTKHIPPPGSSASGSSRSVNQEDTALAKEKNINFFNKIKSNVKDIGQEFTHIAHTGKHALSQAAKTATSHKNAQRAKNDIAAELHGEEPRRERASFSVACAIGLRFW